MTQLAILTQNMSDGKTKTPVPFASPAITPAQRKARLVDLGLWAINHEQWGIVHAITAILARGGLDDA
jgi:hypothetical protein